MVALCRARTVLLLTHRGRHNAAATRCVGRESVGTVAHHGHRHGNAASATAAHCAVRGRNARAAAAECLFAAHRYTAAPVSATHRNAAASLAPSHHNAAAAPSADGFDRVRAAEYIGTALSAAAAAAVISLRRPVVRVLPTELHHALRILDLEDAAHLIRLRLEPLGELGVLGDANGLPERVRIGSIQNGESEEN